MRTSVLSTVSNKRHNDICSRYNDPAMDNYFGVDPWRCFPPVCLQVYSYTSVAHYYVYIVLSVLFNENL